MKAYNFKDLEDRYWQAELTDDEKDVLFNHFDTNPVSPELREMLNFFKEEKNLHLAPHVDLPFLEQKQEAKVVPMMRPTYKWVSIAAAIAILIFTAIGVNNIYGNYSNSKSISQEEAYAEVLRSLNIASENLNKGFIESQIGLKETEIFNLFN